MRFYRHKLKYLGVSERVMELYRPWRECGMRFYRHKLKYLGVSERVMEH